MGTHPIFESDFDCLTEMENVVPYEDDAASAMSGISDWSEWTRSSVQSQVSYFSSADAVSEDGSPKVKRVRKTFKISELPPSWVSRQDGISRTLIIELRNSVLRRDYAEGLQLLRDTFVKAKCTDNKSHLD